MIETVEELAELLSINRNELLDLLKQCTFIKLEDKYWYEEDLL